MAIKIKSPEEIKTMREAGKILAEVLEEVCKRAKPGVSTEELDQFAEQFIRKHGGAPAFKGFHGYPKTICTAVDEIVVHGIPSKDQILKEGDLFTVDCGVMVDGLYTDAARSIGIGEISKTKQRLIKTAERAFFTAIDLAKPGTHVGELSIAIEHEIEAADFKVIYDLTGHGIGHSLHEDPMVLNFFNGNKGPILKEGMTLAVEPIFSTTSHEITTLEDGWTVVTADRSPSVQYENTILITQKGAEILTKL